MSANQKALVICSRVTRFALVLQVCTRVTEELHSFLSQSELSNFFVYIISAEIEQNVYPRKSDCKAITAIYSFPCFHIVFKLFVLVLFNN